MPKGKPKKPQPYIEPEEQNRTHPQWVNGEPDPTIIDPEDQAIDDVFADMPQNENCIELFRTSSQGGRPKFLEQMTPATFSMGYITEKYGGGMYSAKGRYKDGGKVKTSFEIEGDPFPVKRVLPKIETVTDPVTRVVRQFIEQEPAEGDNSQTAMLRLMQTLVAELRGSETEMLKKLQLYKELFAPPDKREAPMDQMINMFTKGVELAGLGSGEGSPWWITVLRELKEPLTKIVDTVQLSVQRSQVKPPLAPVTPAPGLPPASPASGVHAPPEPPSPTLNTMEPDQLMLLQLKAILPMLINGAAKNTDPESYIDFVLDQMPVSGYDALRTWLMKPDCMEQLAAIEPGIRFQQEWWNTLRSGLLETLNEELGHAVRTLHPDAPVKPATEPPPDHDEAS